MDTTATSRSRERDAFREFLGKHRYAPQGRYARVGTLEDKDLDALLRGNVAPIWRWLCQNVKNAEDMDIIQRNVKVARYQIDSCKQEREAAKKRHDELMARKRYLQESLQKASERENALLSGLRRVESEQQELVEASMESKHRDVLRAAFNQQNERLMESTTNLLEQVCERMTTNRSAKDAYGGHRDPVQILLDAFRQMSLAAQSGENVEFGESDIEHLLEYPSTQLLSWVRNASTHIADATPNDSEEAEYAAHVAQNTNSTHDALLQIQGLLRRRQAEHIDRFMATQAQYTKAKELQERADLETTSSTKPEVVDSELWGTYATKLDNTERDLITETVRLQGECQAYTAALHVATSALEDITEKVEASRKQKQDLDEKIELMNQFEERQDEIVGRIRQFYGRNQELIQVLARKQSRLLEVVQQDLWSKGTT
ncbi:hypothetical protein PINS_up019560 [Pythium insidiosum]|nr:hypothetical protein PINS_up019560 [Pythium insidiosum]